MNDKLRAIVGTHLGVIWFGEPSQLTDGFLAGIVLGGEAPLSDNVWLTLEVPVDKLWVEYSSGFIMGYGGGLLFGMQLGCAVAF